MSTPDGIGEDVIDHALAALHRLWAERSSEPLPAPALAHAVRHYPLEVVRSAVVDAVRMGPPRTPSKRLDKACRDLLIQLEDAGFGGLTPSAEAVNLDTSLSAGTAPECEPPTPSESPDGMNFPPDAPSDVLGNVAMEAQR